MNIIILIVDPLAVILYIAYSSSVSTHKFDNRI
jgi:hypothetical protein